MSSPHHLTKAMKVLSRSNLRLLPSRSFHANTPISELDINEDDADAYQIQWIDDRSEKHPFQTSGPRERYVMKRVAEGDCIRMDMPGVGKKDLKVWVDGETVFYKGRAPTESEYEKGGSRHYGGNIQIVGRSEYWRKEDVRAEVRNGVVRILIPTMKVEDKKGITLIDVE